ncbi:MAG TPA: hypothetical protein VEY91_00670 [Candidatus Limnocylindria bacterium]|nr:hypothetical protein [Candidatus Limnocylindria bacterium]
MVRSIDDLPLPGVTVTVNLGNAGARLSRVQTFPGVSLDCNAETISGVTDSQGQVDFVILGGGPDVATAHPFAELRAEIRARGVHLGMSRVAAYDLVGTLNGLDHADFAACIGAVLRRTDAPPMIAGLADYDFNGRLQSKDLAIWLSEYLSRRSESNSGAVCP